MRGFVIFYKTCLFSLLAIIGSFFYSATVYASDTTTVCQWKGNKDGAVSITFDDSSIDQYTNAFPALKQRGLTATYNSIAAYIGQDGNHINAAQLCEIAANGNEIGSHTVNHLRLTATPGDASYVQSYSQMVYEISQSQAELELLTGTPVDTIAYPGGVYNNDTVSVSSAFYIAGRTVSGSSLNSPSISSSQWYSLHCIQPHDTYGSGDANAIKGLEYWSDQAGVQHKWAVDMFHSIGTPINYDYVSTTAFSTYLDYLKANDGRLWIAPMGTVAKYLYEQTTAQTHTVIGANTITVDLNCYLDSRFNVPLTLLTPCPSNWIAKSIMASQGQTINVASHYNKNGNNYISFEVVPDTGTVTLYPVEPNGPSLSAAGNFDNNYIVDYRDLFIFSTAWLMTSQNPNWQNYEQCDFNLNGTVDFADFATFAQNWMAATITTTSFTISGNAGADGVIMSGFPGDPVTSGGGFYSAAVPPGWNGTVVPVKTGVSFVPASKSFNTVFIDEPSQNFTATSIVPIISGNAGADGVTMNGLPGNPVTSGGGLYSVAVPYGWSGTITPTKVGYMFNPAAKTYTDVTDSMGNKNFTAVIAPPCTISGTTGVDGVTMTGLPGNPVTSGGGLYSASVPYGWSGTITPTRTNYNFSPQSVSYTNVTSNMSNRNFSAAQIITNCTISGSAGLDGVTMTGLPGNPVTSGGGLFTAVVPYGWSGSITPMKAGYIFSPSTITYTNVTSNLSDRNFSPMQAPTCTLSGSAGVDGVTMTGLPGNPVTSGGGLFSVVVPYGWSGTITPTKDGYVFNPASVTFTDVTSDFSGPNFTATQITYIISGSAGVDGVIMSGLPGNPVTSGGGLYSVVVPYGWSGTVTPTKTGFNFDAASSLYTNVTTDHINQNYVAAAQPSDANMIFIRSGTFQMGDSKSEGNSNELPVHNVTVSPFYIGKYDITNQQYCDFLNSTSAKVVSGVVYASADSGNSYPYCSTSSASSGSPNYGNYSRIAYSGGVFSVPTKGGRSMSNDPMVCVSWYGAAAYCNWRSQQAGIGQCYNLSTWTCDFTQNGYHLPTEAQWEYAARGGLSGSRFPGGDIIDHSQANYVSSSSYSYDFGGPPWGYLSTWSRDGIQPYTSPVGSFAANGYGLYDMAGNACQWCNDMYGSYSSSPQTNPTGPTSSTRVYRGGCWNYGPNNCRVSLRFYAWPYSLTYGSAVRLSLGLN